MRAEIVDPVRDPRWADLVEQAGGIAFHHPLWLGLLARRYRYEMLACCVRGEDGRLLAGMPLAAVSSRLTGDRLVGLPFSDRCPPLWTSADPAARDLLAGAVREEARRRGVTAELRGTLDALEGAWVQSRFVSHVLALEPDSTPVLRAASSAARRGVRKAERLGVSVRRRTDREALAAFYRLHAITRRRQGVPTQPKRFILGFDELFAHGLGFVALAERDDRVLAAAVFLAAGDTLIYKYGASDPERLAERPNNLLFARVIQWACQAGLQRLDFGRTDLGNEGLRAFKRGLGADEEELPYTYLAPTPPELAGGRLARVAARGIRLAPPAFGRAVGAVLYRHYG